jgi:DNA-binding CsgD family transcriptional regulator
VIIDESEYLAHYGVLRRSGRYPYGSGGPEYASASGFLGVVNDLHKQGFSQTEIAKSLDINTTQLRAAKSIARNEQKAADIAQANRLKAKGMSASEIGRQMNRNESSVRALLEPGAKDKADQLTTISNMLRDQVEAKGIIDIGSGVENHLGISDTKLKTAVAVLKEEGYKTHLVPVPQLGTGKNTTMKVLAKPDEAWVDMVKDPSKIQQIMNIKSEDGGRSFFGLKPPLNIDPSRIEVRYAEQGGKDADGVMWVRPGVHDLSLGGVNYAQVRVAVNGTHYLKGMAMYKDDLPKGVDLVFNTNKSDTGNKLDAMKAMKDDPDNPFGAMVKQIGDRDSSGNLTKVTSAMNKVNEEGNWDDWSRNLSTQFLSKQSTSLAKSQLNMTYENKKADLDEILRLTNPSVKKKLLESFADDADSSAVHLKAAALPRQRTQVILPMSSMKDNEVYAPNFRNGERVTLIRYPHGGTFEIPELVVNNKNPTAKKIMGNAADAIGINHKVAERLSGADFDGDAVLVIPNSGNKVKSTPALERLKDFDPQRDYKAYEGMPKMSARTKGTQMGLVSNLITDMTIKGATTDELARAVRHSMVVIDAEKHNLNYKQSALDHGIPSLMKKYQGRSTGGASTLISNSGTSTKIKVNERKARSAAKGGAIDKDTGKRMYEETGGSYVDKKSGKTIFKKTEIARLESVDDAHVYSSGQPIERVYADHSNRLKSLANQARLASINTKSIPYSPSAAKVYAPQVKRLNAALDVALRNRPLERNAQILAGTIVKAKQASNPDMDAAELKKVKGQALTEARLRTGAKKKQIEIDDDEWKAIQAGAITNSKLDSILRNADLDVVKKMATPKTELTMTTVKKQRAQTMLASGYTQAEVADALGVGLTTLKTTLAGG